MASSKMLLVLAALALLATATLAVDHVVGGDAGWTLNKVNYTEWAAKTSFSVGDKLVFKYNNSAHNVLKVDGAAFKNCSKPRNAILWNTGNDEVKITEQGRQWYICGVADHCTKGMKFVIDAQGSPLGSSAPAPAPTSAATIVAAPMFLGSMVAMLALLEVSLF